MTTDPSAEVPTEPTTEPNDVGSTDPSGPTDHPAMADSASDTSATEVLAKFKRDGWIANHTAMPGARIRCGECGVVSDATGVLIQAQHRIEGASDPDDMQMIVGVACPACGARGPMVASYGPMASEQDQELLAVLVEGDDISDPMSDAN